MLPVNCVVQSYVFALSLAQQVLRSVMNEFLLRDKLHDVACLVPRPLYFVAAEPFRDTWSERKRPFVSDTSPKWIDREGLGKSRTKKLGKNVATQNPGCNVSFRLFL